MQALHPLKRHLERNLQDNLPKHQPLHAKGRQRRRLPPLLLPPHQIRRRHPARNRHGVLKNDDRARLRHARAHQPHDSRQGRLERLRRGQRPRGRVHSQGGA